MIEIKTERSRPDSSEDMVEEFSVQSVHALIFLDPMPCCNRPNPSTPSCFWISRRASIGAQPLHPSRRAHVPPCSQIHQSNWLRALWALSGETARGGGHQQGRKEGSE